MFRNYLKSAFRNLSKNKVFSLINIMGLAVGLGAFLLIFQFVSFEKSFDNFHAQGDNIYRIQFERIYSDKHDKSAGLAAGGGPALLADFPEVVEMTKMWSASFMSNTVNVGDQSFLPQKVFYADEHFFQMFDFKLLEGDRKTVLSKANTVVLSEAAAKNYFGRTNVIGESLRLDNGMGNEAFMVTGVFEQLPANTHFDFDVLLSFQTLVNATDGNAQDSFNWNAFQTYLRLSPGTDYKVLEAKFPAFAEIRFQDLIEVGVKPVLLLQPLKDIYLHSNLRFEVGPTGNAKVVQILTGISIFILVLAYFNYVNLSTSKSLERAKEIGVRKVNGASQFSLIKQFLTESLLLNLIGIVLGFTLMQLSIPFFEKALDRPLSQMVVFDESFTAAMVLLLVLGTLLSGFYPAWVLSRTKTTRVLKGQKGVEGSDGLVRKGLVILQFSILCFLLIGSLAVRSQIDYMLNADWGFNSEQMVVVKGPSLTDQTASRIDAFKTQLRSSPNILEVSNTTMIPGREISWVNNSVRLTTDPENQFTSMPFLGVDETYVSNLGMELIAGRNFNANLETDRQTVLLSRAGAEDFGFTDPEEAVNKRLFDGGTEYTIIGVVENFLQRSFKDGFDPIVYRYVPLANNFLCVRIGGENYQTSLQAIEDKYLTMFPENTFDYFFLDEFFERQFQQDRVFGRLFNFFTLLGVWISVLGLFGLTSYAVLQRRKEIGIRKVLGASVRSVILLISRRFVWLSLIAVAVALPVAYYATNSWLSAYSFATEMRAYVFVLPVVAVLAITLTTTGVLALRSATSNPVDSLRYE